MIHTAIRTEAGHEYDVETREHLYNYILQLADTSLILAQRLTEWCGHGPILEQDIAMSNIALDLLGETRNLFQYAAEVEGKGRSEDDLAYVRAATEYKNPLLVEMLNGNFADTVVRQFVFDTWHYYFLQQLKFKNDNRLAAIAEKSFKEASYHIKWSSEWMIRLGDGTEESRKKIEAAVAKLWPYTEELFTMTATEKVLFDAGITPDYSIIKNQWAEHVAKVFESATLAVPLGVFMQKGGKEGMHTEELGYLLAELQYMQRTYPGLEW
jgi:ring-1,2-phenylacetyl-CoA epoxidase subunit PaaC